MSTSETRAQREQRALSWIAQQCPAIRPYLCFAPHGEPCREIQVTDAPAAAYAVAMSAFREWPKGRSFFRDNGVPEARVDGSPQQHFRTLAGRFSKTGYLANRIIAEAAGWVEELRDADASYSPDY